MGLLKTLTAAETAGGTAHALRLRETPLYDFPAVFAAFFPQHSDQHQQPASFPSSLPGSLGQAVSENPSSGGPVDGQGHGKSRCAIHYGT